MARPTAITPVLRYRDAGTAARWLCEAFGFQEHDRAQELDGHVRYVSLRLGDSIVLLRPVANSVLDELMGQPEAIGGANTQTCYLTVPDVNTHCARAEGAGAKVELKPHDDGLGGLFYACRDLEGHLWSFGTRAFGIAHVAASDFEPVELGPSLPNAAIASPPRHTSREPRRRGQRLRDVAIAAATGVLVGGGWVAYDISARSALRDAAAASTATAARLDDTAKELAHERIVVAELRQAVHRANAESAGLRGEKAEAVRALESANEMSEKLRLARDRAEAQVAAAKGQIAAAEAKLAQLASEGIAEARARLAKEQQAELRIKEELQEAKSALLEANRTIEELRAGQLQPMIPDGGDPVAENSPCVLAVQGKIASSHKGSNTWVATNLDRLCRRAEASVEPAKCIEEIMRGGVNWGAGATWATANAVALCGGTRNARRTLDCFKREIASSQTWRAAIQQCRSS
jgi:uncharacterized glyoxalase superfamily protein PhnB